VLADRWVPPFSDVVDVAAFTVSLPEERWRDVPALLRAVPPARVSEMRHLAVRAYETWFDSPVDTALRATLARVVASPGAQ
jgi:hypothetical protein